MHAESPWKYFVMVNMACSMACWRVPPMMTLRNMVALLGLIPSLAALQLVFDIGHPCYG